MSTNFYPLFESDQYYHVYNQGNAGSKIFFTAANYKYFLKKYFQYLDNVLDTYAYCLIPNHFHFLIKVKAGNAIFNNLDQLKLSKEFIDSLKANNTDKQVSIIISEMFRRFFMSYSKSINEQENRKGSLFSKNVKRKLIEDEDYLRRVVYYIHFNPQRHKLVNDFHNYRLSSYQEIISNQISELKRDDTISIFQDLGNFVFYHNQKNEVDKEYGLED